MIWEESFVEISNPLKSTRFEIQLTQIFIYFDVKIIEKLSKKIPKFHIINVLEPVNPLPSPPPPHTQNVQSWKS